MSGRDLTRWNRAGLSRLRYVDGNAAIYNDTLRRKLREHFQHWPPAIPSNETTEQRQQRVLAEFTAAQRGDWGLELAREVARATHVLTEYLDAYANEATLRTATQWEHVRRLVEMLNYHPAPPASASTPLILTAKAGRRGRLNKGCAVKYAPNDGSPPIIFETLSDLDVDAALNEVSLTGAGRSPAAVVLAEAEVLLLAERVTGLKLGEPVVLESSTTGFTLARLITGVHDQDGVTALTLNGAVSSSAGFTRGDVIVHVKPADKLGVHTPVQTDVTGQMLGDKLFLTEVPRNLRAGEVVYISDAAHSYYRRVLAAEGTRLHLDAPLDGPLHLDAAWVSRAAAISVNSIGGREFQQRDLGSLFSFRVAGDLRSFGPPTVVADFVVSQSQPVLQAFDVVSAKYLPPRADDPLSGFTTFTVHDPSGLLVNPQAVFFPALAREWSVDTYIYELEGGLLPLNLTTSLPKATSVGDLLAIVSGDQLGWARLAAVSVDHEAGRAELSVAQWFKRASGRFYRSRTQLYGHFKQQVRLRGWNENGTPVAGAGLPIARAARSDLLVIGRRLWIEQRSAAGVAAGREASVIDLTDAALIIDPPLPAEAGFTISNTVVRGNLVTMGHGEAQSERILGSGIASTSNQAFVLDVPGVAFVADPTFPAGVRADLDVLVDGRVWQQVGALEDSNTGEPHYAVRITEAGFVRIEFGDSVHGRRLPTGTNNVRVRYRLGTGLGGNLAAGRLDKLARPHPLVDKVRQPLAATGGGDMESRDSLKRNAPASVLTLERAVSVADYTHLAGSHAAVWRARAFGTTNQLQRSRVEVVVVPAGGVLLDPRLQQALEDFLEAHSQPGIDVVVSEFSKLRLRLRITVRVVRSEFDPQQVKAEVTARLKDAFTLERRGIGAPLYMSDVFAVIEAVPGVRNSSCSLAYQRAGEPEVTARQRIDAGPREVIFLDLAAEPGALQLQVEEFEL